MSNMRAIVSTPDGPRLQQVPVPIPRPKEVLVRVQASSLNRADLGMLKGAAHGAVGGAGLPLGLEFAGEIVELGTKVTNWTIGDRVMVANGGAFAEYAVAHCRRMYAIPEGLSFEQATTLPVALQTEHDAIVTNGLLTRGGSILIQGASSAVGLMALQISKYLGAGLVIGTSTTEARLSQLAKYGADLSVNPRHENWVHQVLDATGGKGVDVLIDHVAGPCTNNNMKVTRVGGRIINVGRLGGMHGEFNFDLHALRRLHYVGVTFRTRSGREVEAIVDATIKDLYSGLTTGALRLPIYKSFALEQAKEAFALIASNEHFGKIVLRP
jgi:NADPH2:quinone reductase